MVDENREIGDSRHELRSRVKVQKSRRKDVWKKMRQIRKPKEIRENINAYLNLISCASQMCYSYLFLLHKYFNDLLIRMSSVFGHEYYEGVVLCAVFGQHVHAPVW